MSDKDLDSECSTPARPKALILAPSRELVIKIHKEASLYLADSVIKVCKLYEGTDTTHQNTIDIAREIHLIMKFVRLAKKICIIYKFKI